ncbi:TIGR03752 family integrating conjugative element protein [Photobacterium leiognathi]|uniref:TIGR03752 family integrating conjugative element protein n=1 Tax=Photobacterium leiognathi TaxID=553611 RepID=UPI0029817356|nr:TIGR03752 family integrating conjugative element protein [Photobacterium leiognathi]
MTSKNKLILVLLGLATFVFVFFGFNTTSSVKKEEEKPAAAHVALTNEQAKMLSETLGITADTPDNTLRTLAVTIKAQKEENEALKRQLAGQASQYKDTTDSLQQQLTSGLTQLQQQFEKQVTELKSRTESIAIEKPDFRPDVYDELGLGDAPSLPTPPSSQDSLIWINPMDATVTDEGTISTPALRSHAQAQQARAERLRAQQEAAVFDEEVTPVYTLVRGSVLSDATSLTALIGRIPVNGKVTSPYPFSLVIGKENLMANGFTLPEVRGAIVTGTVTGDWSLSCVRGSVETFDFIMNDGSVISLPDAQETTTSDFSGESVTTAMQIGYLADPNGNPCLSGQKITNAPSYLTTIGVLDAATAAANAVASAQTTTSISNSGSGTHSLTGDAGKYALANAAAGSVSNVNTWIRERMASSFDAIYTPPGTAIAVHLRKTLTIDLPVNARQVRYPTKAAGGTYALD